MKFVVKIDFYEYFIDFIKCLTNNNINFIFVIILCEAIYIKWITNKQNFQIDIINNHILIYIHNMNYDQEKLLLACDIIDNLTNWIRFKIIT